MKKILGSFVVVMCLFTASHCLAFGNSKFKKEVTKEEGAIKLVGEVQRGGYGVVSTAELKSWIDAGEEMVIIDTMPYEASYKKSHIPTAEQFLFPIPDMNEWDAAETGGKTEVDYKALLGDDLNKKIVVYCGFVKCTRSHNGAVWAKKLGYTNVFRHPGGIYAWKGADYKAAKVQ